MLIQQRQDHIYIKKHLTCHNSRCLDSSTKTQTWRTSILGLLQKLSNPFGMGPEKFLFILRKFSSMLKNNFSAFALGFFSFLYTYLLTITLATSEYPRFPWYFVPQLFFQFNMLFKLRYLFLSWLQYLWLWILSMSYHLLVRLSSEVDILRLNFQFYVSFGFLIYYIFSLVF